MLGHPLRGTLVLLSIALSVPGCSYPYRTVSNHAVGFNLALERVENSVLLLNVVRAMKRVPRHYTALTQLRGSLSQSVGATVTIPFGGASDSKYFAAPTTALASAPSFDVAVLDSKKFVRGISTPVDAATLKYLWDSGWPREILLLLLVNEVIIERGPDRFILHNYPPGHWEFTAFSQFVKQLVDHRVRFGAGPPQPYGPKIQASKFSPETLANVRQQKFTMEVQGDQVQLYIPGAVQMICDPCEGLLAGLPQADPKDVAGRERLELLFAGATRLSGSVRDVDARQVRPPKGRGDEVNVQLVLRSPDAVVQFLGELARETLETDLPAPRVGVMTHDAVPEVPLFVVRQGPLEGLRRSFVSVTYDGTAYSIPDGLEEGGRSGTCLSLVSTLMAFYKESDELPTTGTVTVTGVR